jgi:Cu/Ag efflux pump CusA
VRNEGVQYLHIDIDRLACGRFGFNADDIENALRALVEGRQVGVVMEEGRRTPLVLRGTEAVRDGAALTGLRLVAPTGEIVPLASVARITRSDGPVKVEHENATRMAVVQANVRGRDLVGFVEDAKRAVAADLAARAYALGEGSAADVLTARRLALEARITATVATIDAREARYRLLLDAHALWPIDPDEHEHGD